jgi:hypothetical protein
MKGETMIRKVLTALITCLLLCTATIADENVTAWGLGANEVFGLRVGYQWDNVEIGGLTYWDEDNDFREALGGYALYTLPGEFDSNDISWIPDGINTIHYLGIQGTFDMDGDGEDSGFFGPSFGMVVNKFIVDSPGEQVKTIAELQYINYYGDLEDRIGERDEIRLLFGMKIIF